MDGGNATESPCDDPAGGPRLVVGSQPGTLYRATMPAMHDRTRRMEFSLDWAMDVPGNHRRRNDDPRRNVRPSKPVPVWTALSEAVSCTAALAIRTRPLQDACSTILSRQKARQTRAKHYSTTLRSNVPRVLSARYSCWGEPVAPRACDGKHRLGAPGLLLSQLSPS